MEELEWKKIRIFKLKDKIIKTKNFLVVFNRILKKENLINKLEDRSFK